MCVRILRGRAWEREPQGPVEAVLDDILACEERDQARRDMANTGCVPGGCESHG